MRFVSVSLVCLAGAGLSLADNRRFVPSSTFFAMPQYSAGFVGPPAAAYSDPAVQAVLEEVRALRADLEDLRVTMGHPPRLRAGRGGANHPANAVVKAKCAACHGEQAAAKLGKGLVLFSKGQVPELNGVKTSTGTDAAAEVMFRVFKNSMPPIERQKDFPALTDQEVAELVDLLSGPGKPRPAGTAPKPIKPVP